MIPLTYHVSKQLKWNHCKVEQNLSSLHLVAMCTQSDLLLETILSIFSVVSFVQCLNQIHRTYSWFSWYMFYQSEAFSKPYEETQRFEHLTSLKCELMYFRHVLCSSVQPISSAKREIPMTLAGSRCFVRKSQHALATSSIWYLPRNKIKAKREERVDLRIHPFPSKLRCRSGAFTSWQPKADAAHISLPPWCGTCRRSRWVFPPPRGTRRAGWPPKHCTPWSLWWTWLWRRHCRRPAPLCEPEDTQVVINNKVLHKMVNADEYKLI